MFGSANMQSVFLRPIKFDTVPNTQLPKMAPIEKHDPIHDTSDNVIGPLCNGESSDCSFGKFGLNQPIAIPCKRLIKFAIKRNEQKKNPLNKLNTIYFVGFLYVIE